MITLKLLALTLILLGPSAFACAKAERRIGATLGGSLCAQSLLLIALGYVLPFSAAVFALAAASAIAWIYALGALRRRRGVRRTGLSLLLPALAAACCAVFLYDACAGRLYLSWDEYSHWGMIVKAIDLFDELPRAGRGAAYIQYTYPPAAAMLPAMASAILGYRDGVAYLGYNLLIGGLIWTLADKAGAGDRRRTLLGGALLYLTMMAVFPLSVLRLFTEPLIALLTALLLLPAVDARANAPAEDMLYAAMLAMTKNTGLVFVALALAVRAAAARENARALLRPLLLSGIGVASYALYCRAQGIGAVVSPSRLRENVQALLSGTLSESYRSLPARYVDFLFGQPLPQSGLYSCYGFGTAAATLGFTLLLSAAHVLLARERRRALGLWAGVWTANLLYLAMIAASYFFNFSPEEVERLSEADRYTTLPALWTGLLACALIVRERAQRGRWRVAVCALTAALLPLSHMDMTVKTFITREYVQHTVWARDEVDRTTAYIREALAGQPEARLLCMGDYAYAQLHYTLAGVTDIGRADAAWDAAPWRADVQALETRLREGGYTHVFAGGLDSVDASFSALVEGEAPLTAHALYAVECEADGGVTLRRLSTMKE